MEDNYYIDDYTKVEKALEGKGINNFREITDDNVWNISLRNEVTFLRVLYYNNCEV